MSELYEHIQREIKSIGCALKAKRPKTIAYREKANDHRNLSTAWDIDIEKELAERLLALVPEAHVFGEEARREVAPGLRFFIDPIDGTTNFIQMARDYAISVALYHHSDPLMGFVYDVAEDTLYHARKNGGAYRNDERLQVMPTKPKEAILEASLSTLSELQPIFQDDPFRLAKAFRGHRYYGSVALGLCHVAEGRTNLFLSSKAKVWDYAAGRLILEEAGGICAPLFELWPLDMTSTPLLGTSDGLLWSYFFKGWVDING